MLKIGILSDTHGYLHPGVAAFLAECDEIWHAGDIGNSDVTDELEKLRPLRAVQGNIDGANIRLRFPENQLFEIENVYVLMTHIAGYPGKFTSRVKKLINQHRPQLLVAGHSHILKVIYDKEHQLLFVNPGAAGKEGFHHKITCIRLNISAGRMHDLEVYELDRSLPKPVYGPK